VIVHERSENEAYCLLVMLKVELDHVAGSAPIEGTNIDLSKPSISFDLPIPILSFGAEAKISAHVTKTIIHNKWDIIFNSLFSLTKQETNPVNIPNESFFTNSQSVSEWDAYDIYMRSLK
jgi:hypothetical protein